MSVNDTKHTIKTALENFRSGNLSCNAINLFKSLGYNTQRQAPFEKPNYDSFKSSFVDGNSRFNEEKAMVTEWKYVDFLFQISHEEITKQYSAFKKEVVTKEDGSKIAIESFLFFAIELKNETYSRSALSHITREVNKLFPMPAIVLFKHGFSLTLSVINRRLQKRDESKDVLEKVTLIKDINIETPHRAHIDIIFDLSFEKLLGVYKFTNFVELHSAWQKTLDTKELNKKFYKELSNWYFWAMEEVYFPGAALHADKNSIFKEEDRGKEHNAKNLIRLLTRLLFVWFVKEKGLIPEGFFDDKYVADELLVNFKSKKDRSGSLSTVSCYYRAILQNLFFATLNQDMGKREFRKPGQHMNITNLLRYERYFKDPNKYIKLVENVTPFMNGGLFECLDMPDSEKKGRQGGDVIIYQDGFSDRDDNQLKVPDYIFFSTEDHVDLSEAYGNKGNEYRNATVKGLINILKSYKFTVAENTPLEEEVALDPELLGKVFENLLASYNPETKATARKQTGSFYTPREIVNYMVDESLIAYLEQKLKDASVKGKEASIRDLVSYSENPNPFNTEETILLINAIDSSKILDPACGSGAFPMGILHKLVHILHKLDPQNELWKQKQIQKARFLDDPAIREQSIEDIETAFASNELDYGRKLYLIENCIYGVDIQPIATQISKLRFFISLIVEQKVDVKKDNLGVRPLPNLETKFVAADTLVGIEKPKAQITFVSSEVKTLEDKLKDVRHRLFSAKTPTTKRKLREEDKLIREQMGNILVKSGWKNEIASQLANWDPYDQNASSPFFDPEWMFGLTGGFDVVIANPPYVSTRTKDFDSNSKEYFKKNYSLAVGQYDLFTLFIEKSNYLLNKKGILSFIIPKKLLTNENFEAARKFLLKHLPVTNYVDAQMPFEAASVEANVIVSTRNMAEKIKTYLFDGDEIQFKYEVENTLINLMPFRIFPFAISPNNVRVIDSILKKCPTSFGNYLSIIRGMECGFNHPSISTNKSKYKIIKGEHISRYRIKETEWYVKPDFSDTKVFKSKDIYLKIPKLLTKFVANSIDIALDDFGYFNTNVVYNIHPQVGKEHLLKYFLALGNSKVVNFWFLNTYVNDDKLFPHIQKNQLDSIPVIIPNELTPFEKLVDKILAIKAKNPQADTSVLERQIDQMVYKLYDLTEEEIKIIEESIKK